MLDRRKMFGAIFAAGGLSSIAADHAVAITFGDTDYLRERSERLAKHAAEIDRLDAERRVVLEAEAKEYVIIESYTSAGRRAHAFNQDHTHHMPYEHFEILSKRNMIDFIPDAEGRTVIPIMQGHQIKVTA